MIDPTAILKVISDLEMRNARLAAQVAQLLQENEALKANAAQAKDDVQP